jgi:hypothetical protein
MLRHTLPVRGTNVLADVMLRHTPPVRGRSVLEGVFLRHTPSVRRACFFAGVIQRHTPPTDEGGDCFSGRHTNMSAKIGEWGAAARPCYSATAQSGRLHHDYSQDIEY